MKRIAALLAFALVAACHSPGPLPPPDYQGIDPRDPYPHFGASLICPPGSIGIHGGIGSGIKSGVCTSSAFLPTSVSGLKLWFRGDKGVTGSSPVTAWADQSGLANNASVTWGTVTLTSSAIGGKPGIDFTAGGLGSTTNPVTTNSARYVFVVGKLSATTGGAPFQFRRSANTHSYEWVDNSGNAFVFSDNVVGQTYAGTPDTTAHILEFGYDGLNGMITFAIDGVAKTISGAGVTSESGTAGYNIGGRAEAGNIFPWLGPICEIVVYGNVPSIGNKTSVRNYLKARYGL